MKIKQTILFILAVLAASFMYPGIIQAEGVAIGSLIKYKTGATVYYLASDGQKYAFPDEATFLSWNADFSKITTPSYREVASIRTAKTVITARPGAKLVKLSNSPRVYVVAPGAILRWLKDEAVTRMYYGKNWEKQLITLSLDQFKNYIFGEDIDLNTKFSKTKLVVGGGTVDDELRNRGVIKQTKVSLADYSANEVTLRSISENLSASFQPRFNLAITSYHLTATYQEDIVSLLPTATDKDAQIYINGIKLKPATAINFDLQTGSNNFVIKVVALNGSSLIYHLTVVRENPNPNALLESISENLRDNLSPQFNPEGFEYEMDAAYDEAFLKLKFLPQTKTTKIFVNGQGIGADYSQSLSYGENKITVLTRAENGNAKKYVLTVNRRRFPSVDATDLVSITENLTSDITPVFEPNMTRYFLSADAAEAEVRISARAKSKDAYVYINGEKTTVKTVYLGEYRNDISIVVALNGGFEKEYIVSVYRVDF